MFSSCNQWMLTYEQEYRSSEDKYSTICGWKKFKRSINQDFAPNDYKALKNNIFTNDQTEDSVFLKQYFTEHILKKCRALEKAKYFHCNNVDENLSFSTEMVKFIFDQIIANEDKTLLQYILRYFIYKFAEVFLCERNIHLWIPILLHENLYKTLLSPSNGSNGCNILFKNYLNIRNNKEYLEKFMEKYYSYYKLVSEFFCTRINGIFCLFQSENHYVFSCYEQDFFEKFPIVGDLTLRSSNKVETLKRYMSTFVPHCDEFKNSLFQMKIVESLMIIHTIDDLKEFIDFIKIFNKDGYITHLCRGCQPISCVVENYEIFNRLIGADVQEEEHLEVQSLF